MFHTYDVSVSLSALFGEAKLLLKRARILVPHDPTDWQSRLIPFGKIKGT